MWPRFHGLFTVCKRGVRMAKSKLAKRYPPEFHRQMVGLVRIEPAWFRESAAVRQ
jgi:hypothetical protein